MDENQSYIKDIIRSRRSCRFFDPNGKVKDRDIDIMLDAAKWAPSARNLQPLEFVIVREKKRREKLTEYSRQPQPSQAPVSIVVLGDLKRARDVGDISPHDTTTHIKGLKMFLYMDAAAAIQNMLLMAESLGYASLWIASFDEEDLDSFMELPNRFIPLSIICIGDAQKEAIIPPKRELIERVHSDDWKPLRQSEKHLSFSQKINEVF